MEVIWELLVQARYWPSSILQPNRLKRKSSKNLLTSTEKGSVKPSQKKIRRVSRGFVLGDPTFETGFWDHPTLFQKFSWSFFFHTRVHVGRMKYNRVQTWPFFLMTNDENIHTLGLKKGSVCEFQVCLQMLLQSFVSIQNISSSPVISKRTARAASYFAILLIHINIHIKIYIYTYEAIARTFRNLPALEHTP